MPFDPIFGAGFTPAASTGIIEEGFDYSSGTAVGATGVKTFGPLELSSKKRLLGIRVYIKQRNVLTCDFPTCTVKINGIPIVTYQLNNVPYGTAPDYPGLVIQETIPMNMDLVGSNTLQVDFGQNSAVNYDVYFLVKAQLAPL